MKPFRVHIIICFLLSFSTKAQEYSYYSFNELYDFDVETIYNINQDPSGDFWFGTSQGLVQFNGRDFRKFSSSNYSKDVTNIKFDAYGRVWCSNFGGQLFYLENDSLHTAIKQSPGSGYIKDYFPKNKNQVYILSDNSNSLLLTNIDTQRSEVLFQSEPSGWILNIFEKGQDFLILSTDRSQKNKNVALQQYLFNPENKLTQHIKENHTNYSSAPQFATYYQDSLYLTVCSKRGIKAYNLSRSNPLLFSKQVASFDINNIAIHNNQIVALRKTNVSTFALNTPHQEKVVISNKNASCLFEDHEGNLWFGTLDEGIFIVPNLATRKSTFNHEIIKSSVFTENKELFFITSNGAFCSSRYPFLDYKTISTGFTPSEVMVYDPVVKSIFFTNHRQFYDVRHSKLKLKNDYDHFKDIHFLDDNNFITTNGQSAILQTIDGKAIPLNTSHTRYNFNGARFPKSALVKNQIYLRDVRSLHIAEAPDKAHLYINFIDGVYLYTKKNVPQQLVFKSRPLLASTMQEAANGVWISTNNGYLLKFEKGEKIYEKKLPESVHRIAECGSLLFLYSQNAIYRLDTSTNEISQLGLIDGVDPNKVSKLFCHNDSLFIIGASTIQRVASSYKRLNTNPPTIHIDGIAVHGKSIEPYKHLFKYNENHLSFSFHAMAIRSQQNYHYEYRITKSAEWNTLSGSSKEVALPNLEPGDYNFQIRVVNGDGLKSKIKNYSFTIEKHFVQQLWFSLLILTISTVIIGLIIRYRYKHLQHKNKLQSEQQRLKKEVYKSKIAAIRSQMNPHFMFNALNTIQEFIITNQKSVASEYLADFADLMRKYLEQSKYEEITLNEEIETLEIYLGLENLRFDGDLAYSIHTEPTVNPYETTIPVMLLQPFVENAIKHGLLHKAGKKTLTIRFSKIGSRIQCVIEDNGIGRKASLKLKRGQAHLSFATSAIDQKTDLVNKNSNRNIEIQIIDLTDGGSSNGTRVNILFDL